MPNEQGKGMRRPIAAASSGRLARCAAGRATRAAVSRFSHSIAQNHSHRSARLHLHRAPPLPARMSASNHISSCTSVRRHWLLEPSPPRPPSLLAPSLPPSLPLTAIYPSLIGLRNLSRTGKDEASEGANKRWKRQRDGLLLSPFSPSLLLLDRRDPRARKVGMESATLSHT